MEVGVTLTLKWTHPESPDVYTFPPLTTAACRTPVLETVTPHHLWVVVLAWRWVQLLPASTPAPIHQHSEGRVQKVSKGGGGDIKTKDRRGGVPFEVLWGEDAGLVNNRDRQH